MALIHHPVVNRKGEVVASAVTNLDLHDIARAARTYGVRRFYVATPLKDQRRIAGEIIAHWIQGAGARLNPLRKDALALIRLTESLNEAAADVKEKDGRTPFLVATSAKGKQATFGFADLRRRVRAGRPVMVVLGTAWGLAPEAIEACDGLLAPISGGSGYNHLSVRSAAAIIFDRIFAPAEETGR